MQSKKAADNREDKLSELPNDVLLKGLETVETQSKAAASNGEDRLRELPNVLLLNILERVGTLDAVRACILSKQMQKLPTMLSQIIIDPSNHDLIQMDGVVADMTKNILQCSILTLCS